MSRRAAPGATLPGTAVAPLRPTLDDIIRATARPVPPVPGQQPLAADGPLTGSFCTGYGGLDQAVQEVFGGSLAWVSDVDPGACKILAHRHSDVPNIGDLTVADYQQIVETYGRPDIVCGGYPCQPFSLAGELKGTDDERHLWPHIARALGVLRPRYAVFENVANHLRLGFDTVLRDLADLGFDVEWDVVRADEVDACHQRRRLIILATAADAPHLGHERGGRARGGRSGPPDGGVPAADAGSGRLRTRVQPEPRREDRDQERRGDAGGRGVPSTDPDGRRRGPKQPDVPAGEPDAQWGRFAPAIARWEAATGRRAPWATDDRGRLSPEFVEWMMGLDAGHVTAVPGLTRTQQLKALGNGVVPQQAAAALRMLLARSREGQRAA
ncbi:DNA cytosine methyltransferase [Streptomyces sp. NPDC014991]|uniref:DNA cytosine methyltransferase n=1 Tax=Streptomyces sp. NPDC014991 TaxID=3364935 RepID=UPI00370266AC